MQNLCEKYKNTIYWVLRKIIISAKIIMLVYILKMMTDNILPFYKFSTFIIVISAVISLRFILRLFTDTNLNSYFDLFISSSCFCICIRYILERVNVDDILDKLFLLKTSSKIFQLFIIHILIVFSICAMVSLLLTLISITLMFIVYMFRLLAEKDILNFIEEVSTINKKMNEKMKIDILKLIDEYINPFKNIYVKPLYENMRFIKKCIFIIYIIIGLIIIFYWNDYAINEGITEAIISKNDLDNYRVLFITPLLGIFINKIFSKDKNSNS